MNKPKFSVIIPAHNEEDVIERAIKSVQNQTFQNFEIIVSNDGSTDKTREIVEKMMRKDKRIRILNHDKGHSAAFARNRGAEVAKGDILVFLDADTKINKIFLFEISKKYGKSDGFITLNYPLRENFISYALSGFLGKPQKEKLKDGSLYNNKNKSIAGSMFFAITKKAYESIGKYNEKTFYYEDQLFVDEFYNQGFKAIFVKKANQYYELPSTFKEFLRQCEWIGKGINTIPNKKKKQKRRYFWFSKFLFLILPIFFIGSLNLFIFTFIFTFLINYSSLIYRNKMPLLSLIALPFLYLKTILVSFSIIKFYN